MVSYIIDFADEFLRIIIVGITFKKKSLFRNYIKNKLSCIFFEILSENFNATISLRKYYLNFYVNLSFKRCYKD